jgi:hypothetical protein
MAQASKLQFHLFAMQRSSKKQKHVYDVLPMCINMPREELLALIQKLKNDPCALERNQRWTNKQIMQILQDRQS